ncbi:MAG: hypothetical protein LBI60_04510 [Bacteroidales bacterium]|nr:hypothetical protein [Bacteroidales bacterium]
MNKPKAAIIIPEASYSILEKNTLPIVIETFSNMGWAIVEKEEDLKYLNTNVDYAIGIKILSHTFSYDVNVPVFGQTGISSINTNYSNYGLGNAQANSTINYNYGITGYRQEQRYSKWNGIGIELVDLSKATQTKNKNDISIVSNLIITSTDYSIYGIISLLPTLIPMGFGGNTFGNTIVITCNKELCKVINE